MILAIRIDMIDWGKIDDTAENDFANSGQRHSFECTFDSKTLTSVDGISLKWGSIKYYEGNIEQIPDDKQGIYAFVINHCSSPSLPPHGYVVYIGKTERSLRARYKEYLHESQILGRPNINAMMSSWRSVLLFLFAPVQDNVNLKDLEEKMNDAMRPHYSKNDYSTKVTRGRNACL